MAQELPTCRFLDLPKELQDLILHDYLDNALCLGVRVAGIRWRVLCPRYPLYGILSPFQKAIRTLQKVMSDYSDCVRRFIRHQRYLLMVRVRRLGRDLDRLDGRCDGLKKKRSQYEELKVAVRTRHQLRIILLTLFRDSSMG